MVTDVCKRDIKKLAKKYPSIASDISNLNTILESDPLSCVEAALGMDCYKIRMQITGKNSGKSGAARIIAKIHVIDSVVYLIAMYDKATQETMVIKDIRKRLKDIAVDLVL
ncbi:hypothetical protein EGT74_24610 [Chitinophaga lutea]|uniref:Addiction module toxin RelE n=1 Tax=Chitinophaga lutea TaxID=2488634 RepID=A0A3N4PD78_9BACT|nr:hypothetical protein EGT74_24610 [Chitinophaga lutea]